MIAVSFLLPSAECDLDMNSARKGWVTSSMFIGKLQLYLVKNLKHI